MSVLFSGMFLVLVIVLLLGLSMAPWVLVWRAVSVDEPLFTTTYGCPRVP